MKNIILRFLVACIIVNTTMLLSQEKEMTMAKTSAITHAVAVITPTKGNSVHGIVTFTMTENGMHIVAKLSGLKSGKHGFHIHEFGDISSEDGTSAGGHFNPAHMPHNMPSSNQRHAGDMGNIVADETGNAQLDMYDTLMTFEGASSIIGRAVIVHEKEDDYTTQPTGNAGTRIGNGIIGIAK